MRPLPPVAAIRHGVFTGAEAAAAGWSRSGLEHAARRGRVTRLQRGVWATTAAAALPPARAADLLLTQRAIAGALSARGAVVSHLGSGRMHDLPVWAQHPRPCNTLTRRERGVLDHVHTHRSAVPRGHRRAGVVFTTISRTVADVTREFGVEAGLVTADAALHELRISLADLEAEVRGCRPAPGGRRLTTLLDLVDAAAESPLESRSRWHLHVHDVPPPRSQVVLRTTTGRVLGRCDFFWAEGVVGEVDGDVKYESPDARAREKWRQELMERTGLLVVRWGHRDLADFAPVAALIADRRARASRPGWPREWIAEPAR